MMEQKDDESIICLRRCDLHSVLTVLSLGNKGAVDASWQTLELLQKKMK